MSLKEELREKYYEKRQNLSDDFIKNKSEVIINKLDEYVQEHDYKDIMIFVSFRNEVISSRVNKDKLTGDSILDRVGPSAIL